MNRGAVVTDHLKEPQLCTFCTVNTYTVNLLLTVMRFHRIIPKYNWLTNALKN
jgi:hypothetical protein